VVPNTGPIFAPREQQVLEYLRAHPGRLISRNELSRAVWGFVLDYRSRAIDQTVANLRKKLHNGARIVTHHGRGYEYVNVQNVSAG
jgi:DNA-binding response OmpR family regulator